MGSAGVDAISLAARERRCADSFGKRFQYSRFASRRQATAKREIDAMGIGCEPASATTLAGVRKLRAAGLMSDDERIVCVLTGHILKDPDSILKRRWGRWSRKNN